MNIIRKYKLHRLGIPVDKDCLRIIKFIEDNILNLEKVEMKDKYPDSIFYFNDKYECILELEKLELYVIYEGIWDVFHKQFNLGDVEIQQIMKYLVEKDYNYNVKVKTIIKTKLRNYN